MGATQGSAPASADAAQPRLGQAVSAVGFVLAISYPLLALSTGVRAIYQLGFRHDLVAYHPSLLSLLAAVCYLVAAIGFGYRRRWSWYVSVAMLAFETVAVLVVGGLSVTQPDLVGRTVWRQFGADYGYFPLIQPVFGLIWLFWPATPAAYGIVRRRAR